MHDEPEVAVLRLGHRPGRDDRMTTHVGLTARALGADRVVFGPEASGSADTVRDITDRFGGPFAVEVTDAPKGVISDWTGPVVHLTMYGLPVQDVQDDLRGSLDGGDPVLFVVGAEKVSFDVYERADHNVAVTNQPHSEVASLAVALDRLFDGRELDREWADADREVVPMETGKRVVEPDDAGRPGDGESGREAE
ncbi:tRNA (cytidine(56)-2'-O)-methyltransferase [Halosimplex halobium]|uniref:tRNA (cytidine(56)-2'-O)-methyltransferase n=1 Tax=Halosimplex halobium TaxID=3396618 RepID=UPI003F573751